MSSASKTIVEIQMPSTTLVSTPIGIGVGISRNVLPIKDVWCFPRCCGRHLGNALVTPAPSRQRSYVMTVLGNTRVTPVLSERNPVIARILAAAFMYVSINADYTT